MNAAAIEVIASAVVSNGRWGDHHISVQRREYEGSVEFVWRNGWSDPLVCETEADAMRFFNARIAG